MRKTCLDTIYELAKKDKIGLWQGQFKDPYLYRKNKKK